MQVRAVLLDLDGTLLDHRSAARTAFLAACRRWLPGLDEDARHQALARWRQLEALHMRAYLDKSLTFPEQRRARLRGVLSAYGRDVTAMSDPEADDLFVGYLHDYEKNWIPYGDVAETMGFLAGAPAGIAVLSNGDRSQQEAKLVSLGLQSTPLLFTPSDIGAAKPDPASFLGVCERMGWEPAEVLYVGNDLHGDAVAAADAGLQGCWLDRERTNTVEIRRGILHIHSLLALTDTTPGWNDSRPSAATVAR